MGKRGGKLSEGTDLSARATSVRTEDEVDRRKLHEVILEGRLLTKCHSFDSSSSSSRCSSSRSSSSTGSSSS